MSENPTQNQYKQCGSWIGLFAIAVACVVAAFLAAGLIFLAFAFARWALTLAVAA